MFSTMQEASAGNRQAARDSPVFGAKMVDAPSTCSYTELPLATKSEELWQL
jgi:hypothetical protein